MASLGQWVAGARPRTLPASIVPVLVGTAATERAVTSLGDVIWWRFAAALVVALAIQVGANYANDYSDGVRGSDAKRVGPMRLVASGAAAAAHVRNAALGAFLLAAVVGLALAVVASWWLVAVGAACFAAAWLYTGGPRPYGYAGFGEIAVFVFFGVVATAGSAFVQDEAITAEALGASVPVGIGAVALLVTNNLRDIDGDAAAGKMTLAVRMGDGATRFFYVTLVAAMFCALMYLAIARPAVLLAFAAVPVAALPVVKVLRGATGVELIGALVGTARLQIVFGVLLAAGLLIGPELGT